MFNSKLQPMFNDSVLMNDKAIHDKAVMNALQSFAEDNFEFKNTSGDHITVDEITDSWRQPYDVIHDGALGDYPEE